MSKSRTVAWAMWMIASIFYAYQYIIRVMPNIMMSDILAQFQIDSVTFGQFSGIYYIGYSLMHMPLGIMLDRFGPKRVMPVCILMSVAGLLPILFADYWVYPVVGRLLIGMGSSAAILGVFKIVRLSFSEARFTRMLSLSVTIGLLGAIYGGAPVNYMCAEIGYKAVVSIFALMGVCLSIATYCLVPSMAPIQSASVWADMKEVFGNKKAMAVCLFAGLMVGPLEGFADVWGTQFLKQVYGYEGTLAASLPSMIFVGMCFGAPVLSLIAEKTRSYLGTIIAAGVIMALAFFALISGQVGVTMMGLMFAAVGVCSAYQIIAIYKASTYVREQVVGLTTAVANMIIMIFGYFFHSVIGGIVSAIGGTDVPEALIYGVGVVPVALAIGTLGFMGLALVVVRAASKQEQVRVG